MTKSCRMSLAMPDRVESGLRGSGHSRRSLLHGPLRVYPKARFVVPEELHQYNAAPWHDVPKIHTSPSGPRDIATARELPDPAPLLVASGLESDQVAGILIPYGVEHPTEADSNIQSMAGDPHTRRLLATILPNLLAEVAGTADPDQALNHWERLLSGSVNRSSLLQYLHASPKMLGLLCTIFGNSDSLAFALIRDPMLVYWLAEEDVLSTASTREGIVAALRQSLGSLKTTELKLDVLRRVRRREMLRIGVRDLLHLATVEETTSSLSDLASVLIHAAYEIVDQDLKVDSWDADASTGERRVGGDGICRHRNGQARGP